MEQTEIKIGDRVKLKNDANSPEMTVLKPTNLGILKSLKMDIDEEVNYWDCGYYHESKQLIENAFHKDALQKLTPVQPSNKQ